MAREAKKRGCVAVDDSSDAFAAALAEYKEVGLAVIPNIAPSTTFGAAALRALLAEHKEACQVGWFHESGAAVHSPQAFLDLETSAGSMDPVANEGALKMTQPRKRGRSGPRGGAGEGDKESDNDQAEESNYYYASFVVNGGAVLNDLLSRLPFGDAPSALAAEATHAPRAWCFAGRNYGSANVAGRAEHTDDVPQDGTWHLQLRGTKVWKVRPCLGAKGAPWGDGSGGGGSSSRSQLATKGATVPKTTGRGRATRGAAGRASVCVETKEAITATSSSYASELIAVPAPRVIECRAGDLLLINTRTWWHCTELPPQRMCSQQSNSSQMANRKKYNTLKPSSNKGHRKDVPCNTEDEDTLSLSIARDFNWKGPGEDVDGDDASNHVASNVDAVYCTGALSVGDVALMESELPDCALPRSDDPNCEVVLTASIFHL